MTVEIKKRIEANVDVNVNCSERLSETLHRCKKITIIEQPEGLIRKKITIIGEDCQV
jgi:hypothetical protein